MADSVRITDTMVVADVVADTEADMRTCAKCGGKSFHIPQSVMVYTPGGARKMRLWTCETHPLPDNITAQSV